MDKLLSTDQIMVIIIVNKIIMVVFVGIQLYLPYVSQIISNFSMVYASQFYDVDHNSDSYNDGLWCQSDSNRTNIGAWYFPNGTQIPLFAGILGDSSSPSPLFTKQCPGQIVLGRKGPLIGLEGLYVCVIPDVLGINQTLVVGLYADTSYNKNGECLQTLLDFQFIFCRWSKSF